MHQIGDVIVRDGKLLLSDLPFTDGQHVKVMLAEIHAPAPKMSIHDVRALLRGCALHLDDVAEPMIPIDTWEMLK